MSKDMRCQMAENFKELLRNQGTDVVVVRGTRAGTKSRGLKSFEKENKKRTYFGFPPGTDVESGDIIEIPGSKDRWLVIETEGHMAGNTVVQMKAIIEKYQPITAKQPTPVPLALTQLHTEVQRISGPLVANGHLRQAITDTFIGLDNYVKKVSGIADNGTSLMQRVFSASSPALEISSEKEEQTGFMMLFVGAMKAIRNQYAHNLVDPKSDEEALEWLGFASSLFRLVDGAKKHP